MGLLELPVIFSGSPGYPVSLPGIQALAIKLVIRAALTALTCSRSSVVL